MGLKQRSFKIDLWERFNQLTGQSSQPAPINDRMRFLRAPHTIIAGRVIVYLTEFVEANDLGFVTGDVDTIILSNDRYTVRAPDVGFVRKERMPEPTGQRVKLAPDLAVKVVMPNETKKLIENKVLNYMRHGTRMVWVIFPDDQVVDVYRLTKRGTIESERYDLDRSLDGGDVLPGFRLPVNKIFPKNAMSNR